MNPGARLRKCQDLKAALATRDGGSAPAYQVTPVGLWTRSNLDEVFSLFQEIDLGRYKRVADLGSGDGRVVCLASLFTGAVGIEADAGLVAWSRSLASSLKLPRAEFQEADLRSSDLTTYDLMYIFPDKPLDWLEGKPAAAWSGSLLVYGPNFLPQKLEHLATLYAGATVCTLWRR